MPPRSALRPPDRPPDAGPRRDGPRRNSRRRWARRARLRKVAASLLAALAVFVSLAALTRDRDEPRGVATVVAVRALPAGTVLTAGDVEVALLPSGLRPDTAFPTPAAVVGQTVSTALDAHEVLTPARLVGPGALSAQPQGRVAMSVPVLDAQGPGARPGTHVDLYATGSGAQAASDVVVLAVASGDAARDTAWGQASPVRLTLALDPATAARVAKHLSVLASGESFVVAVRRASG